MSNYIYTLEQVVEWFEKFNQRELTPEELNRIIELYNMITNPLKRVNSPDKRWVACTDNSEKRTVVTAIALILKNTEEDLFKQLNKIIESSDQYELDEYHNIIDNLFNEIKQLFLEDEIEEIEKAVNEVCKLLANIKLTHKDRIPFYILVLDRLIEEKKPLPKYLVKKIQ